MSYVLLYLSMPLYRYKYMYSLHDKSEYILNFGCYCSEPGKALRQMWYVQQKIFHILFLYGSLCYSVALLHTEKYC